MSNSMRAVWLGILLVVMIVLPFLLPAYWQDVLVLFTINVILVMSYRLITTMGGWSFAHIAIMGLGAYTMALLTTKYYSLSFWITLPIGGLVSALFAVAISYPVLRTRKFYFFLSTFAKSIRGKMNGLPAEKNMIRTSLDIFNKAKDILA